jgi:hypothetical protein
VLDDNGQRDVIKVLKATYKASRIAGAFNGYHVVSNTVGSGDRFYFMALLDRLVELKEIREVSGNNVCGQDRIFVVAGAGF